MNNYAGDLTPQEAWLLLKKSPEAVLIDVRTQPEWAFVGIPDLSTINKAIIPISWQIFPNMIVNPRFISDLTEAGLSSEHHLCFLCRSGVRSVAAAKAATAAGFSIFSVCLELPWYYPPQSDFSTYRFSPSVIPE